MSFFYKTKSMFLPKVREEKVIALAGNPNVGKSTIFNALTGMNQKTGNWTGKTVGNAMGKCYFEDNLYTIVDIPGTYSLFANSAEEEVARDYICFGKYDAIVVVIDATSMERNLNLVLQILETNKNVIVCVNLLDEAGKKKIHIDLEKLSSLLGVPVVGISARNKKDIRKLLLAIKDNFFACKEKTRFTIKYSNVLENAISIVENEMAKNVGEKINSRWISLRLLEHDEDLECAIKKYLNFDLANVPNIRYAVENAEKILVEGGIIRNNIRDLIVETLMLNVEKIYKECVSVSEIDKYSNKDRNLDKILTSKTTGIPIMIILLGIILWLTIVGANYPSTFLFNLFMKLQVKLEIVLKYLNFPDKLSNLIVFGIYRTVAWITSVMLPPMAIFFPLFTLLEDFGYLPRIAFNLDKCFKKSGTHGKQALTMCMGFGCNACGVTGCRIIDSPRERLIAILTNNFIPCNGRFPILIGIATMFFSIGTFGQFSSTLILTLTILFSMAISLVISRFLSSTFLKGESSSFALELPPYRVPQFWKVIVRSIFDRTLIILGRALTVAAPAGVVIWCMANICVGNMSLFSHCTMFLEPFARIIGLDGIILFAFILGIPANEIVFPIILMGYLSTGSLTEYSSLIELKEVLLANGWNFVTAICTMMFCLFHFPCATTLITIYKETRSAKWTVLGFLLPTAVGIVLCATINLIVR